MLRMKTNADFCMDFSPVFSGKGKRINNSHKTLMSSIVLACLVQYMSLRGRHFVVLTNVRQLGHLWRLQSVQSYVSMRHFTLLAGIPVCNFLTQFSFLGHFAEIARCGYSYRWSSMV